MSADTVRTARADTLVTAMAREVRDGDVVGVGLGTPLAVLAVLLARATHAPGAHLLVGGAVDPEADLATCLAGPAAMSPVTTGYVPHLDTMDMAERQAMTLQFLRPAQVDGAGRLNVSRVVTADGREVRLPGGLATADVPALLPRLVVYLPRHERRSLPDRVHRTTGGSGWAGDHHRAAGVVTIVTDLAVIRMRPDGAVLDQLHAGVDRDEVVAGTGFGLGGLDAVRTTPEPSDIERAALRRIDPDGLRHRHAQKGG